MVPVCYPWKATLDRRTDSTKSHFPAGVKNATDTAQNICCIGRIRNGKKLLFYVLVVFSISSIFSTLVTTSGGRPYHLLVTHVITFNDLYNSSPLK